MNRTAEYDEILLLGQISRSHEPSFRQIYDRYHQRVYTIGFFLTRSQVLAEDITQEIFAKIWIHRKELTEINHFENWLRVLVRNHTYNYLNRMAREKRLLKERGFTEIESNVVEDFLADKEFDIILKGVIDKLPPQQKKVYLLSRQDGLKVDEISALLGLSVNTVKNHLKAALAKIRTSLEFTLAFFLFSTVLH